MQSAVPQAVTGARDDSDAFERYKADIALLSGSRAEVATAVKQLYRSLDDGYASLPDAAELQRDASTIQTKLAELAKDKTLTEKILQVAYAERLEEMAKQLEESPVGSDAMADILLSSAAFEGSNSHEEGMPAPFVKVDVRHELERAGRMDRLALLRAQENGLDAVRANASLQLGHSLISSSRSR